RGPSSSSMGLWIPACAGMSGGARLRAPAHRRHGQPLALAGTLADLRALAELQVAREANPHLGETWPAAGHRDAGATHARVRRHERVLDFIGRDGERTRWRKIIRRDLHLRARLADGLEVAARGQPGTNTMLVPLVEDEPRRRHQIEHRRDDVAVEPRRGVLA